MRLIVILLIVFSYVFSFTTSIINNMTNVIKNFIPYSAVKQTQYHEGPVDFYKINPDKFTNIYGNLQITGNTVMCVTNKKLNKDEMKLNGVTKNDYLNNYKRFNCTNDIYKNDNKYLTKFIDIDDANFTFNSSSAIIKLPGTYKEIAWVGLFWQGYLNNYSVIYKKQTSNDLPNGNIEETNASKVLLKINDNDYHEVIADRVDYIKKTSRYLSGEGAIYSAWADITDIVKQYNYSPNQEINITVANISTSKGSERDHGDYGGWSVVVIYKEDQKNDNSKLRNNSVYYGFDFVSHSNPIDIEIKNLVLPNKIGQEIKTYMALFSAEGEYKYKPDYALMNGKELTENLIYNGKNVFEKDNVFDARLSSDIKRYPELYNNDGLDIDIFNNVSQIMTDMRDNNPNQKSYNVTISLRSDNERFSPSCVVFSTELYEPRVCYYIDSIEDEFGNIVFENGNFIKDIDPNKEYKINLWISNMKKSQNDVDLDTAKKVKVFLNMSDFDYTLESTEMKNIGVNQFQHQTDAKGDDLFSYIFLKSQGQYHVGEGANASEGGTIEVASSFNDNAHKAFISFHGKFETNANQQNINLDDYFEFKASFATDFMTIDEKNAIEISKCIPFDASANIYIPESGTFNVVESTFNSNIDPVDVSNHINDLYTKIVGEPFSVKIVKLNNNKETLEDYNGLVRLDIINDPEDEDECKNNPPLWSGYYVFHNASSIEADDINVTKAIKKARFRVVYLTDRYGNLVSAQQGNACLNKTYNCVWGLLTQIATSRYGNECPTGTNYVNSSSRNYSNNRDYCNVPCAAECNYYRNRSQDNNVPSEECLECIFREYSNSVCSRDDFAIRPDRFEVNGPNLALLKAGQSYNFIIKAVGKTGSVAQGYDANLSIKKLPLNSLPTTESVLEYKENKSGCITGDFNPSSQLTIHDGVVTYNAYYTEAGEVNVTIKEVPGNEFALVDIDDAQNPKGLTIQSVTKTYKFIPARFEVNPASINYSNGGNGFTYISNDLKMASKLDFMIKALNDLNNSTKNYNPNCYAKDVNITLSNLPLSSAVTNKIIYNQELNPSADVVIPNNQSITFVVSKSKFDTQGSANPILYINFEKKYNSPQEPFDFTITDINATNVDNVTGVSGPISKSAHFIYGRINIPDVVGYSSILHNTVKYEYYKNGKWEVNQNHSSSNVGDINSSLSITPDMTIQPGAISQGYQDIVYRPTRTTPYSRKVDYSVNSWLWYHPNATIYKDPIDPATGARNFDCQKHPCNKVSFLAISGGWAGVGENNSTYAPDNNKTIKIKSKADVNASKSQVKHLNW